ncbi:hypothetical protein Taro_046105 [Colocasia esculenta]|uniref:Uncharacterized protein n=1 Tax=Colocasia esculenta TaxID=4460 RepID=A0A843WRC7_COLES|nr:hypothetical protein [Colocasia esculenta]
MEWSLLTVVGMEDPEMVPGLGFSLEKATDPTVAIRSRQADPSRQDLYRDTSWRRDQKAVMASVAIATEDSALQPRSLVPTHHVTSSSDFLAEWATMKKELHDLRRQIDPRKVAEVPLPSFQHLRVPP